MTDKQIKKYCDGLDCSWCNVKEPCIYKIANELEEKLSAKEKECKELKKIINEAKNSKLDLKSFLVGEAVQNEYEQQLDQLKAEVELLKQYKGSKQASYESMQIEWNNAINENKKLKADNEQLTKNYFTVIQQRNKAEQTLTEIKEMCSEMKCDSLMQNSWCGDSDFKMNCCEKLFKEQILNKIKEVEE